MDLAEAKSAISFLQGQNDHCNRMITSIKSSVEKDAEEVTLQKNMTIAKWKLTKWDTYWIDVDYYLHNNKDLPAIDFKDEDNNRIQVWYRHGFLHRTKGPAVIRETTDKGTLKQWWLNGVRYKTRKELRDYSTQVKAEAEAEVEAK